MSIMNSGMNRYAASVGTMNVVITMTKHSAMTHNRLNTISCAEAAIASKGLPYDSFLSSLSTLDSDSPLADAQNIPRKMTPPSRTR